MTIKFGAPLQRYRAARTDFLRATGGHRATERLEVGDPAGVRGSEAAAIVGFSTAETQLQELGELFGVAGRDVLALAEQLPITAVVLGLAGASTERIGRAIAVHSVLKAGGALTPMAIAAATSVAYSGMWFGSVWASLGWLAPWWLGPASAAMGGIPAVMWATGSAGANEWIERRQARVDRWTVRALNRSAIALREVEGRGSVRRDMLLLQRIETAPMPIEDRQHLLRGYTASATAARSQARAGAQPLSFDDFAEPRPSKGDRLRAAREFCRLALADGELSSTAQAWVADEVRAAFAADASRGKWDDNLDEAARSVLQEQTYGALELILRAYLSAPTLRSDAAARQDLRLAIRATLDNREHVAHLRDLLTTPDSWALEESTRLGALLDGAGKVLTGLALTGTGRLAFMSGRQPALLGRTVLNHRSPLGLERKQWPKFEKALSALAGRLTLRLGKRSEGDARMKSVRVVVGKPQLPKKDSVSLKRQRHVEKWLKEPALKGRAGGKALKVGARDQYLLGYTCPHCKSASFHSLQERNYVRRTTYLCLLCNLRSVMEAGLGDELVPIEAEAS